MLTIFLADDHVVVREGLRLLLETQPDFRVMGEATNGREAVQQIAEQCPDIALLDIVMPEMNGIEVISALRKVCPATKAIIVSMYKSKDYIVGALKAGARGYLLKTSSGKEVINLVRAVQAGEICLDREISNDILDYYLEWEKVNLESDLWTHLTGRERQIFQLVVAGKSSIEIAQILALSVNTVDTYRSRLMSKLGVNDVPNLVKFAIRRGLIALDG